MSEIPLYNALKKYIKNKIVHFDVPGHKRNPKGILLNFMLKKLIELDVSSAKPIDYIDNPKGPLKKANKLMAKAFSSDYSFFMVNGTTSAVQNMIIANIMPKEKIILPRNIHKSVINGLISSGATPIYIEPELNKNLGIVNGITVENTKKIINKNKDAKCIFIINPTYYGITSDIENIISLSHNNNLIVLCDEAHGTHFYFNKSFPSGCMEKGADLSAVSMHKTGGSLTQSSILLCNTKLINIQRLKQVIDLTQTTSPSYILLSSLDVARCFLETKGFDVFEKVLKMAKYARNLINSIGDYYVIGKELIGMPGIYDLDETKLVINTFNIGLTGFQVYDILRDEYKIQVELGDTNIIVAIISIGDTKEDIDNLINALKDIKNKYKKNIKNNKDFLFLKPEMILTPREAFYQKKIKILLKNSLGKISGESIVAYPPGIPIILLGEKITKEIIQYIEFLKKQKCVLTGMEDPNLNSIYVLKI